MPTFDYDTGQYKQSAEETELSTLRAELAASQAEVARLWDALEKSALALDYVSGYSTLGSALTMIYSAIETAEAAPQGGE